MALNKVNYVDNQTIITAQNLNNIQDSIINLENDPFYLGYVNNVLDVKKNCAFKYNENTLNTPYKDGLTGASDGICLCTIVNNYISYICYPTTSIMWFIKTQTPDGYSPWYNSNLELSYPINSIYLSWGDESPAYLFGGTWELLKDRFLLGAGGNYPVRSTGGETTHQLTLNEMPAHNHSGQNRTGSIGYSGDIGDSTTHAFRVDYGLISPRTDLNISVQQQGGNAPHNNMPPYLAVYMWRRIA